LITVSSVIQRLAQVDAQMVTCALLRALAGHIVAMVSLITMRSVIHWLNRMDVKADTSVTQDVDASRIVAMVLWITMSSATTRPSTLDVKKTPSATLTVFVRVVETFLVEVFVSTTHWTLIPISMAIQLLPVSTSMMICGPEYSPCP
jgi:hypothetical protein